MSKKRILKHSISDIASNRMSVLFKLSEKAIKDNRLERAERYVDIIRHISRRTRTLFSNKTVFCKRCNTLFTVGRNFRVRVMNGRIKITCLKCGEIKRIPYLKEQKNDGKGC